MSQAFEAVKNKLADTGVKTEPKGKILIATVQGDIHDIGKNIVKAMLENYGYEVIDLGKDISPEAIADAAEREKPGLIGLSALMTTTVVSMEKTISLLRERNISVPVMVGGAVLTPEYAESIGADYYAKDAMASVKIAKKVFEK
ncbi:cobalamin-dependent protein [Brucepastera parasyntrophica]|uniref:cobalamin-dependent protein n=1 Tax=Brucepastera parasyntrophica TaxID=2880008 RepID=UPI00210A9FC6|nr:cobalamin-dependent protein [Brucepastera parasyntrophica]ULQ60538.1 cobalamin-dependent protein [Brucepastera parasyntrophica]